MSSKPTDEKYQVTWLVRRLFRAMAKNATERLDRLQVTAADRAILEFLHPNETLTVPELAANYQVSRQHVQVTANGLIERKLISTRPNPTHKRSSLLALTSKGRRLFESIKKSDTAAINALFSDISRDDTRITRQTLQALLEKLNQET